MNFVIDGVTVKDLPGEVVWTGGDPAGEEMGMGIEFAGLPEALKGVLARL